MADMQPIDQGSNELGESICHFEYDHSIRKLIYTTNPIEGVHRQIRKITKTKGAFSSEQSFVELMYMVIKNISKNGRCLSTTVIYLFKCTTVPETLPNIYVHPEILKYIVFPNVQDCCLLTIGLLYAPSLNSNMNEASRLFFRGVPSTR